MNPTVIHPGRCGDNEFDFVHSLQDTLHLLGVPPEIVALTERLHDKNVSESDLDKLGNYNCELFAKVKVGLSKVHTIKIQPSGEQ